MRLFLNKIIFALLFTTIYFGAFSQTTFNETTKIALLCKFWGFLKYYHPNVATGKYDWDKELITKIPQIKASNTKEDINKVYIDWLTSLGQVKKRKNCNNNIPDSLKKNLDLNWLTDTTIFNKELISKLNFIKENRSKHQYYIKTGMLGAPLNFKKEKIYKDSIFPSEGYRLLGLFRYWNIINYFYPYKYLTDEKWDNVLIEMTPKFQNAQNPSNYHLAMLELTTKINDSHAYFSSDFTWKYIGVRTVPFKIKIIENKAIIIGFYNDSLSQVDDLQYGDVILKINNKNISEIIAEKLKYISASNEPTKLRNLAYTLFNDSIDTLNITYERHNEIKTKTIKRYYYSALHYNWTTENGAICKELNDNIGYVNMGNIKMRQVAKVMNTMMTKKGIIFDIRNYPNATALVISQYLNKDILPFVQFLSQDLTYPGVYKWSQLYYAGKKRVLNKWFAFNNRGKPNKNYYKGKVVLLINEDTQSQAEFTCMAIQTAPDVKCIGSQTAGADGNVSTIIFPGGYRTQITGLGVYYPNGKETQRIGIEPDIEVKPTIDGLKNKKDEVLERAIEYINTGK